MLTRFSVATCCPTAANISRTCRFLPSCIVMLYAYGDWSSSSSTRAGQVRWPSISTPFSRLSMSSSVSRPVVAT